MRKSATKALRTPVTRYVQARKPWHLAVTLAITLIEVIAIFTVHEMQVHLALTGTVTTWELLVTSLGE